MKASDSTNSLTALTEVISEVECFICLEIQNELDEPLVDSKLLRTCGCKFVVPPACWNKWMKNKSDWDCPICHKESLNNTHVMPNPVIEFVRDVEGVPSYRVDNSILYYLFGIIVIFGICVILALLLTVPKQ